MKTKARFFGLFLALFGVVVLTSCDKEDDIRLSDVPVAVMNAFELKYPNVGYAEWEKKKGYYVADFWQEGMDTHVWIDSNAEWKMTELDFGPNIQLLPQVVQDAFQGGEYAHWRVDDIGKYERYDRTFYLIEVETKGEKERDLYYDESGVLLKDEVDRENNDITPDTKL